MQPVQYRGYAQGTAFNPIILSDQSRKILEQNEQFLRGLQEKQKIERDIEVAKLKQLQGNIESQRQQLNENFNYDQRQRSRYNQSLQESAAREVQDLKRIAALQPDKPTTVAVVNEIADFLVSTSQTAAEVIGQVKEARTASDIQAANDLQALGSKGITDAYIGGKAQEALIIDTAKNAVVGKYATYAAFKESGYQLQAGQEVRVIKDGVQAQLALSQSQQSIKTFEQRFNAQSEYEVDGQKLTRQQFQLLDATQKQRVFQSSLNKELAPIRGRLSSAMTRQIDTQSGAVIDQFVGKAYKQQSEQLDGQVLEASRQQLIANPTPDNIHSYGNIFALHNGGDRAKSNAELTRILSDPDVVSDAQLEHFADTTYPDQLGNNSTFRKRNAVTYNDILERRSKSQLALENSFENNRVLAEKQMIRSFHTAFDQDKSDGRIDDATSAQLAEEAQRAEANGYTELARLMRSNINLTADFQQLESQREQLNDRYANGTLEEKHVRDSGLTGEEYTSFLDKAIELRSQVSPTKDNLGEAENVIKSSLRERLTGGYAFEGTMPGSYHTGVRRETERYKKAYRNEMRKSGDHATAHKVAMGEVSSVIGTDETKGLYRVPNTYDEIAKQLKAGGRIGDFVDSSLRYAPLEKAPNTITEISQRVDDLGAEAIKTVVTPQRLKTTFNNYRETGRMTRDPGLEVAAQLLQIPYAEAHNLAADQLKDESLKLPKKLYDGAIEMESVARGTSWRKFLNSRAKLEQSVITGGVLTELSGAPYALSAAAKSFTSDFDGLFNSLATQESGGDPSQVNTDSGATGLLQVMPENIGPWSQEILGRAMTKEEFLADPEAQRKVGRGKLRQYYNEYILRGESPDEAIRKTAASWYAGPNWESAYGPDFHNSTKPQMFGGTAYPSMYEYTTKVLQRVRDN